MNERFNNQVAGSEFLRDPILVSAGVVEDVASALPRDSFPHHVLQVQLKDRGPLQATITVTIRGASDEKKVIECPVRADKYDVVRRFFERKLHAAESGELASLSLPKAESSSALLAGAEKIVSHLAARCDASRSRELLTAAIGDAIGIALMVGEEARALELSGDLQRSLRLSPGCVAHPSQAWTLLNSIAPVVRAAAVSDRLGALQAVVERVIPKGVTFAEALPEKGGQLRFGEAMCDLLDHGDSPMALGLIRSFQQPALKLKLLNLMVDAVVAHGTARAINTCAEVVAELLPECKKADDFARDPGLRIRAFSAALSGSAREAEDLIDDIPRWFRSDPLVGWVYGVTTGLKVRSKHNLIPRRFVVHFKNALYVGNENFLDEVGPAFVKGLVASTQGTHGAAAEELLQAVADHFPALEENVVFTARRFIHQLVLAMRNRDTPRVEQGLKDLVETARDSGQLGDDLFLVMCEELSTDVMIRNRSLRSALVSSIVDELRASEVLELYELSRLTAGEILYTSGFRSAALKVPPPYVVGDSGRLLWRIRALAAVAGDRPVEAASAMVAKMEEEVDSLVLREDSGSGAVVPTRAADWTPLIAEAAAVNAPTLSSKVLLSALSSSKSWTLRELQGLSEALLSGLIRRARAPLDGE